jgi:hypothetical protein
VAHKFCDIFLWKKDFDSNICIGVFLQFQLHTRYCTKITLKRLNPRETSERMNFNVIDKKNN